MRFLFLLMFFLGCQNQKKSNQQSINVDVQVFSDSLNNMSFKAPKDFFVQDGFYAFSSKEMNSKISLEKLISEDLGSVFSKEELIEKYKKDLHNVVVESKDDWFIIKGINSKKNLIVIKGIYSYIDRLLSEEENPSGESIFFILSSTAGFLNIEYPEKNPEKMNLIIKKKSNNLFLQNDS
jgi:hypothetical protein